MVAAGQVDVDRLVDVEERIEVVGDGERVAFRVRHRELAAAIAGAGDEPGAHRRGLPGEAAGLDAAFAGLEPVVGHAGDEEVLPDGEPDIAVAEILGDARELPHLLGGELAGRQHDSDPVQAGLFLRVDADMGLAVTARRFCRKAEATRGRGAPSFFSTSATNFSKPQSSSRYLSRALARSVRSPCSMKTRTSASATFTASSGLTTAPVSRAKSLCR